MVRTVCSDIGNDKSINEIIGKLEKEGNRIVDIKANNHDGY